MPTYRKQPLVSSPVQHSYAFTRDEVICALEAWCASQGLILPAGERHVEGVESRYGPAFYDNDRITLYIEEAAGR